MSEFIVDVVDDNDKYGFFGLFGNFVLFEVEVFFDLEVGVCE